MPFESAGFPFFLGFYRSVVTQHEINRRKRTEKVVPERNVLAHTESLRELAAELLAVKKVVAPDNFPAFVLVVLVTHSKIARFVASEFRRLVKHQLPLRCFCIFGGISVPDR